jgi:translation initiation factor 4G
VQTQSYNRYAETDNRDWRSRIEQPVQTPAIGGEEKSWDKFREAKESYISSGKQDQFNNQDKLSSQFSAKAQVGPAPALVKAEVPWSIQRGNLSNKERVLKTVKGYCLICIILPHHFYIFIFRKYNLFTLFRLVPNVLF